MWAMVKRLVFPTSLAVIGLAGIICGAGFHTQPVLVEQEVAPPAPPLVQRPPPALRFLPHPPPLPRPPPKVELVTLDEPELLLTLQVTVGGVTRLASGALKRTYRGDMPSLCPT